jgi:hypothetical protein
MTYVTAAWATVAVSAAVLVLGTYYRSGPDGLRQNARPIATLLLGVVLLVTVLTIAMLATAR